MSFYHNDPYVFISISDPGGSNVKLGYEGDGLIDILRLQFDDKDPSSISHTIKTKYQYITDDDAKQIIDFYEVWKSDVSFICIHCGAGISRSSATAAALQVVSNGPRSDNWIFQDGRYMPNRYVYRKILAEAHKRNLIVF